MPKAVYPKGPGPIVAGQRARLEAEADMILGMAEDAEKAARKAEKAKAKAEGLSGNKITPKVSKAPKSRGVRLDDVDTNQLKKTRKDSSPFNLKGVAEVLIEAGLNPAEEILRVMPQLEPDVSARLYAELLQYVQPKLKSIEITGKGGGPLQHEHMTSDERLSRISELTAKVGIT